MTSLASRPRVYLDTGVLAHFADERGNGNPTPDFDAMQDAMFERGAVLVISGGHVLDAFRKTDVGTRARLAETIDSFPTKAMATANPVTAEHAAIVDALGQRAAITTDRWDVPLWEFRDTSADVFAPVAAELTDATDRITQFTDASRIAHAADRKTTPVDDRAKDRVARDRAVKDRAARERVTRDIALAMARAITNGWPFDRFARTQPSLETLRKRSRGDRSAFHEFQVHRGRYANAVGALKAQRSTIAQRFGINVEQFIAETSKYPEIHAIDHHSFEVGGLSRWLSVAPTYAPGSYLRAMVGRRIASDRNRNPDDGDKADLVHVSMVPYVDIITLDAFNVSAVTAGRKVIATVRNGLIQANSPLDLGPLTSAIKAL